MAKIERLPSGTYRTRVYDRRLKKQISITADSKAELKLKAAEYATDNDPKRDMTVSEAVNQYIEDRSAVLSPSTIRSYEQIKSYFKDIGPYSAKLISGEDLQKFVNDLSRKRSPKTVRNVYGLLSSALQAFYPNKAINVRLPQKKPVERFIPTTDAVKALLDSADPELRKAILLASCGTMRRGEIAALKFKDIEGNIVHVHADIVKNEKHKWVYKDIPKTSDSDRYIEYPPQVIKELGEGDPDEYVVKVVNPDAITKRFKNVREACGLRCRFHDLRAYAASIAHALGVPDEYVMQRGGWSSDAILKSVYRNALSDEIKKNSEKINSHMGDMLF